MKFAEGMKAGAIVALSYIPISITFGVLAKASGISDWVAMMMSIVVYAGASQFVGIKLFASGVSSWEAVLTTFIINLRHFLLSASLSQRVEPNASKRKLALTSFGITDETFSVASLRPEKRLSPEFILGLNFIAYSAWIFGTTLGIFLGKSLPASLQSSMGIALYAMFIGLIIPSMKKSRPYLFVGLAAAAFNWIWQKAGISEGFGVILATVLACVLGAIVFKGEKNS